MPCIVCHKDRWSRLRVPLQLLSEAREHYFRENYFTNYEFDHVCRYCHIKEGVIGAFINTVGFVLNLMLRGWVITLGVLLAFGCCVKFSLGGQLLEALPVLAGLFIGIVLGNKFIRWFFLFGAGFLTISIIIVFLMHSDTIMIMPDVHAMAQREQMAQNDGELVWDVDIAKEQSGMPASGTTTPAKYDPIAASKARSAAKRQKRMDNFFNFLKTYSPVEMELTDQQFAHAQKLALITLGLYLVIVTIGAMLFGEMRREEERKERKKRKYRFSSAR